MEINKIKSVLNYNYILNSIIWAAKDQPFRSGSWITGSKTLAKRELEPGNSQIKNASICICLLTMTKKESGWEEESSSQLPDGHTVSTISYKTLLYHRAISPPGQLLNSKICKKLEHKWKQNIWQSNQNFISWFVKYAAFKKHSAWLGQCFMISMDRADQKGAKSVSTKRRKRGLNKIL